MTLQKDVHLITDLLNQYDKGELANLPEDAYFRVFWSKEHKENGNVGLMPLRELKLWSIECKKYDDRLAKFMWGGIKD